MASPEMKPKVCLMCLVAPAVGKLGTCEHSYCESCLLDHIKGQITSQHQVISCPACRGQTRQDDPTLGKNGTNVAGGGGEGGEQDTLPRGLGLQQTTARDTPRRANCKLCHFKGKTVKAVNMCKECKSLPLCGECSQAHPKNKATQNHVVTVFVEQTREEVFCKAHDEVLKFFCYACSMNVCHVCISLDHVDHAVEIFNDVVNTEVVNVRSAVEEEETWLEMLKSDDKELQESKANAQEMEDVLIKSIEDHAEKCIEEILKNKDALKKQVKAGFEGIHGLLTMRLEAMPELQRASADVLAAAHQLLNEQAELHSTYVEKLIRLKTQLEERKEGHHVNDYEKNKKEYRRAYKDVNQREMTFYPRMPNCKIGGFKDPGRRCNTGGPCVCETCGRAADAARVAECRQKGTCTCGTCGQVSKWPNESRGAECRQKGTCTCGTCGQVSKWRNESRDAECRRKGTCTCRRCGQVLKWRNESRDAECRRKGTCTCRRCGQFQGC
ncbi:E3 ubiquitin-protein ligase TRIM45-like isoform X2 [Lineus longissimus]|uniref:E3 ubiquitin-protein ligase TRIM45-like isoform X2 n=1 Tax=Lineus longissimus TaxID=88925 RepID=UPI00315DF999